MALRLRAPAASGQIDEAEARRALPFLCDPEGKVQLAPYPRFNSRCVVGPDREEVYQAIQRLAGDCRWLYWTINPIDPAADLEGRNARIGDILRRRWFLVDVDPKRPEGAMSTHDEHEHAREVAWNVVDDLGDRGWPSPWIIDSGSGFHLLWQVDLPNDRDDPRIRKQYGRVLAWLGKTHDSDRITIDANVGSANQNSKVPGTWVRKGANSPDRPHRLCRTVHLPEELECVPYQAIADLAGPDPPERPKPTVFEARAFGNDEGRLKAYGKAALSREIQRVLMSVAGENRNILYNAACYNLYRLVAGGCIDDAHCYAELLWAGQQIGLGEREARYHLDRARKQGMENPRAPEARPEPRLVRSSANGQHEGGGDSPDPPPFRAIITASRVPPRSVDWLWRHRIPRGKLTTFAGIGGLGKTFVLCDITARVSAGLAWPDGMEASPRGDVLFISGEDDADDTLVPRLIELGADLGRIHFLSTEAEGHFTLRDLKLLSVAANEIGDSLRLVVIDPPTAYLGGADDHKNAELRQLLTPLKHWAKKHECALVFNTHVTKGSGQKVEAMMRVMGSVAWVNAVRAAHIFARDPDDPERRLFVPMKMNIGKEPRGLAYRLLITRQELARVEWLGEVDVTADQAINREGKPRKVVARDWLVERFGERLEWESAELFERGKHDGVSRNAIFEAKESLDLPRARQEMLPNGDKRFVWWVPSDWPHLPRGGNDVSEAF